MSASRIDMRTCGERISVVLPMIDERRKVRKKSMNMGVEQLIDGGGIGSSENYLGIIPMKHINTIN
jgi:hypothetical protein